ncbi:patatin-like phospholipase family protein [Microbaculum marinum]|uniref:Patatin-like phospholipase family protein n=1 Tax=Microbaculum marinum TaxID=1764581 RepID=A0AAW9RXW3_9HYPH
MDQATVPSPDDTTKPRSRPRPSIGIALGGGAARGWAHIGVLRTLEAAGYVPDIIAGTSIGAVVGGCYAAGKLDGLEDFALTLSRRRMFGLMDFNFGGSGLITGTKLSDLLERQFEDTQTESLPKTFCAIATELGTGHEIWLSQGRLVDAMRASYALPGVFRPVKLGARWLIDGALVNPIPVSVCRAMGARLVIAVNLHSDVFGRGSVKPYWSDGDEDEAEGAAPPRNAGRLLRRQMFGHRDGAPGISSVMIDAFNITQDRIARARLGGDPPDVTVSPRMRKIGLFEFHRAREAIALGIEAAERALGDIGEAVDTLGRAENA